MIEARIVFIAGPLSGTAVSLGQPKFIIGRSRDCSFIIDDESLSRDHCVLLTDEYGVRVRDLGSKNGTAVNGVRLDAYERSLAHGDIVSAGVSSMRVELGPATEDHDASTAFILPKPSVIDSTVEH